MEKYPLSVIQHTLIEWKYTKNYTSELKTYDLKERLNGELDIILQSKINIINNGGSYMLKIAPVKFHTTIAAMAALENSSENERLRDFLRDLDNETYIKAEESENNTRQRIAFFAK